MALRKFNKYMKVVSVIVIISLVMTAVWTAYTFFTNYNKLNTILVKVEDEKVLEKAYETDLALLKGQINYYKNINSATKDLEIPTELYQSIVLNNQLKDAYISKLAKKYKVNISSVDIENSLKNYETQIGSKSKLAFLLSQQGKNINDLRNTIRKELEIKAIGNKIAEKLTVTDEQLKDFYNLNSDSLYKNKKYDDVKELIKNDYLKLEISKIIDKQLDEIASASRHGFTDDNLKKIYNDSNELVIKEHNIKLKDIQEEILYDMLAKNIKYEEAKKDIINSTSEKIKYLNRIKDEAIKNNIIVDDSRVTPLGSLELYYERYRNHFIEHYQTSEHYLKDMFTRLKSRYDKPANATGIALGAVYTPSQTDIQLAYELATKLKLDSTKDNFAEMSEKATSKLDYTNVVSNSADDKLIIEKEIKDKKVGEIVGPIKVSAGYTVLLITDEKDGKKEYKSTLIPVFVSETTKEAIDKKIAKLKDQLDKQEIKIEDVLNNNKYNFLNINTKFENLTSRSQLGNLPVNIELNKHILSMDIDKLEEYKTDTENILIKVSSKEKEVQAKFEEYKEIVRKELARLVFNSK